VSTPPPRRPCWSAITRAPLAGTSDHLTDDANLDNTNAFPSCRNSQGVRTPYAYVGGNYLNVKIREMASRLEVGSHSPNHLTTSVLE
jgi:hypothetical protein